ncbi:MAG: hypothetical protein RSJ41_11635, partial [Clostridia bacterium]
LKNVRDGELNFRQIRPAKAEGVAELRPGFCRTEMTEMQPPARVGFNQRFPRRIRRRPSHRQSGHRAGATRKARLRRFARRIEFSRAKQVQRAGVIFLPFFRATRQLYL